MDSDWVVDQTRLYLIDPLRHYLRERQLVAFVSGDSFVYYHHQGSVRRLGPDFYVVKGGVPRGQTKWVTWEEGGLYPSLVIEFLSESTETRDRGEKFCTYRDVFKTEEYFLVDPDTLHLEGYTLTRGHYLARQPEDGWFFCRSLGLWLGVVDGWVRFRSPEGDLLWTGREVAERESKRAEQEKARAEQAILEADLLRQELRRLRGEL